MAVSFKARTSLRITQYFFDRPGIMRMVDEKTRKALSLMGGLVRKIARRSIRKRKKPSAPGTPPSSHRGLLKNFIFYAYDSERQSVVIGPTRLNQQSYVFVGNGQGRQWVTGAAPSILERGGMFAVREVKNIITGEWGRIPWSKRLGEMLIPVWKATPKEKAASLGIKTVVKGKHAINFYRVPTNSVQRLRWVKIAARPYMAPAALKARDSYPAAWGNGGSVIIENGD